jgi:predicted DNA-binding protein
MKAASLSASLLVAKGAAGPSARRPALDIGGTVEFLRRPEREPRGTDGTVRVSLRMSLVRHLRLRLAAAHLGRSNQALMLAAIDHYIDNILPLVMAGHCACLEQGRMPAGTCIALGFGRGHSDPPA